MDLGYLSVSKCHSSLATKNMKINHSNSNYLIIFGQASESRSSFLYFDYYRSLILICSHYPQRIYWYNPSPNLRMLIFQNDQHIMAVYLLNFLVLTKLHYEMLIFRSHYRLQGNQSIFECLLSAIYLFRWHFIWSSIPALANLFRPFITGVMPK